MFITSRASKLLREPSLTAVTSANLGGNWGKRPCWHPTKNYVIGTGVASGKELVVYWFDGVTLTEKDSLNLGVEVQGAAWSPNGSYVCVGSHVSSNTLRMYSWSGSTETLTLKDTVNLGSAVYSVVWSKDGDYIAAGSNASSKQLAIYSFDGSTFTEEETVDIGHNVYFSDWSRYDKYLAVGKSSTATNEIEIYSWNSGTKTLTSVATYSTGIAAYIANFMHNNDYIITHSGTTLRMMSFDGSSLTSVETVDLSASTTGLCGVAIYKRFIYLGAYKSGGTQDLYIYSWDEQTETLTQVDYINSSYDGNWWPALNYNKRYLATGPYDTTDNVDTLAIFTVLPHVPSLTETTSVDSGTNSHGEKPTWHPTNNYVIGCAEGSGSGLVVYSFDGTTLTEKDSLSLGTSHCVGWSPNGNYVCMGTYSWNKTDTLQIYSWNSSSETLTQEDVIGSGTNVSSVKWSKDGNYIAVSSDVGTSGGQIGIYTFNGSSLTRETGINTGCYAYALDWSRGDKYLAVGKHESATNELEVFSWNSSTKTLTSVATYSTGSRVRTVSFMYNNDYIIINSGATLQMMAFNGSSLTVVETVDLSSYVTYLAGAVTYNNFIYVGAHKISGETQNLYIYLWNERTETLTQVDNADGSYLGNRWPAINYNKKYLATGPEESGNTDTLSIYTL